MGRIEAVKAKEKAKLDLDGYMRGKFKNFKRVSASLFKRVFQSSLYVAHNGEREKARRVRQIERGIIPESQILRNA